MKTDKVKLAEDICRKILTDERNKYSKPFRFMFSYPESLELKVIRGRFSIPRLKELPYEVIAVERMNGHVSRYRIMKKDWMDLKLFRTMKHNEKICRTNNCPHPSKEKRAWDRLLTDFINNEDYGKM